MIENLQKLYIFVAKKSNQLCELFWRKVCFSVGDNSNKFLSKGGGLFFDSISIEFGDVDGESSARC
jgi:hypothetical protein